MNQISGNGRPRESSPLGELVGVSGQDLGYNFLSHLFYMPALQQSQEENCCRNVTEKQLHRNTLGCRHTLFSYYLVEVVERFVQIGVHASGRLIGDLDGVFQNSLWDDVIFWCGGGFGTDKHPEVFLATLGVLLQKFLQRAEPASHQVNVLQDSQAQAGDGKEKILEPTF